MGFDFNASQARAAQRLGMSSARSPRSDRGVARLDARVEDLVGAQLLSHDRPDFKALHAQLVRDCRRIGVKSPSRSSLYLIAGRYRGHTYTPEMLPPWVSELLHNVDARHGIPGRHVVFACLNYGDTRALSFAAGLPWLDLYQARTMRGFRAKSRGLLDAICLVRGV